MLTYMQLAQADESIAAAKEARRSAEAAAADASFRESQAERRSTETREVAVGLEEKADAMVRQLRAAQSHIQTLEAAAADQHGHVKEWEARLVEADHALTVSEQQAQVCCMCSLAFVDLLRETAEVASSSSCGGRAGCSSISTPEGTIVG
jgi:hypothetical protein